MGDRGCQMMRSRRKLFLISLKETAKRPWFLTFDVAPYLFGCDDARFVDRYMPGYLLFLDTIQQNDQWKRRSKTITIDLDRTIVDVHDW